jgi:hypothetical protein
VKKKLWWHVYGGVTDETCQWGADLWVLAIYGESKKSPKDAVSFVAIHTPWPLTYLQSFDHDPTDAEKAVLTPEEYREQ